MSERGAGEAPWLLVTGGSRGIGRAVAVEAATRGWDVVVAYLRNEDAARQTAARVTESGRRAVLFQGNLANPDECGRLVAHVRAAAGRLDGCVHCAALGALAPATETRANRWRLAWDTHVAALLELLSRGRDTFRPGATVVAVSSLGTERVMPGYAPLGAAKGALEVLVRYLAVELAPSGINVNAVRAGPVDTDSLRAFPWFGDLEAESRRRPPGRLGTPEDVAKVIIFLLGPDAAWIRGQIIVADGGFSLH